MAPSKKRVIKSLDNLSEDLKELIRQQYPNGYEGSISRIVTPKKEQIFVFPLETDDATYLIKLPATKNSEGEYDVESTEKGEFGAETTPKARGGGDDDDFDNSGEGGDDLDGDNDGDNDSGSDYDEEGGGKRNREASYDPDFDA